MGLPMLAGQLALAAAAAAWGLLNNRGRPGTGAWRKGDGPGQGTYRPFTAVITEAWSGTVGYRGGTDPPEQVLTDPPSTNEGTYNANASTFRIGQTASTKTIEYDPEGKLGSGTTTTALFLYDEQGNVVARTGFGLEGAVGSDTYWFEPATRSFDIDVINFGGQSYQPLPFGRDPTWKPIPLPRPRKLPSAPPTPSPMPMEEGEAEEPKPGRSPIAPPDTAPLPNPLPLPDDWPGPVKDPTRRRSPSSTPGQAPRRVPQPTRSPIPVPGSTPMPVPGVEPERAPAPPVVATPIGIELLPNGQVVGQPGQEPRPTPEGIAQELGRIEGKTRGGGGGGGGGGPDTGFCRFQADPFSPRTWDLLNAPFPPGAYTMQDPCSKDDEGNPVPPEFTSWPGGAGPFDDLIARLDAVADLLQIHKDQPQPVCTNRTRGRPVSVKFVAIPEDE